MRNLFGPTNSLFEDNFQIFPLNKVNVLGVTLEIISSCMAYCIILFTHFLTFQEI